MTNVDEHARKRKSRSPSYPSIDLETAIKRAEALYAHEARHFAPIAAILSHWDYGPKSSGGLLAVAALKRYGLLEDRGSSQQREARVSDLALRILADARPDSSDRLAAIREAALSPRIHRDLWDEYSGSLPSDATLRFNLITGRGFTSAGADDFIRQFRLTVQFAHLDEEAGQDITPPEEGADFLLEEEGRSIADPPLAERGGVRHVQLPLAAGEWATLAARFPITESDWSQMMDVLAAMKPALVVPDHQRTREGVEDGSESSSDVT